MSAVIGMAVVPVGVRSGLCSSVKAMSVGT